MRMILAIVGGLLALALLGTGRHSAPAAERIVHRSPHATFEALWDGAKALEDDEGLERNGIKVTYAAKTDESIDIIVSRGTDRKIDLLFKLEPLQDGHETRLLTTMAYDFGSFRAPMSGRMQSQVDFLVDRTVAAIDDGRSLRPIFASANAGLSSSSWSNYGVDGYRPDHAYVSSQTADPMMSARPMVDPNDAVRQQRSSYTQD